MAKTFRDNDGDIRAVMKTMFDVGGILLAGAYRAKVKTPFEMIVSAVRATGAQGRLRVSAGQPDRALWASRSIASSNRPAIRTLDGMDEFGGAAGAHEFRTVSWRRIRCRARSWIARCSAAVPAKRAASAVHRRETADARRPSTSSAKRRSRHRRPGRGNAAGLARFSEEMKYDMFSRRLFLSPPRWPCLASAPRRVAVASLVRGRCAQPAQENPGGDLPARRDGRLERRGAAWRKALLRSAAQPRDPPPEGTALIRPSTWTASSACIRRCAAQADLRRGQSGDRARRRFARSDALALRRPGLHGIRNARAARPPPTAG